MSKKKKIHSACCARTGRGSVLAYALVILMVVSIILVSALQYISSQIRFSYNRQYREQSFQIAEAGIYFYRWYLSHETSEMTVDEIEDFWQNSSPLGVDAAYEAEFSDPQSGPIGRYSIEVTPPESGSTIIYVKSTGWTYRNADAPRTIQVRMRRPSWSEHAILVNDVIHFGENTEVFGKIHSNFGIRFDGLAHNLIESAVDQYDDPDHQGDNEYGVHTHNDGSGVGNDFQENEAPPSPVELREDVFEVGREFPVPVIDFNGLNANLDFMKSEAMSGNGIYYDNSECDSKTNKGRHIILNGTTMTVKTVTSYNNANLSITNEGCTLNNVAIPSGGIVFVENNLWIEGTIDSRRTTFVAANLSGGDKASIYIGMGNILYTNHDGTDIIGLLAQDDIQVIKNSLDDLTIDAAILSQSGQVGVNEPFGCNSQSCTDQKDTLTINGSLATYLRYGFSFTNGTGYAYRILNFDNNLLFFPPPYFPTSTQYKIDLWEEL